MNTTMESRSGDVVLPDTVQLQQSSCRETVKTCAITHLIAIQSDHRNQKDVSRPSKIVQNRKHHPLAKRQGGSVEQHCSRLPTTEISSAIGVCKPRNPHSCLPCDPACFVAGDVVGL